MVKKKTLKRRLQFAKERNQIFLDQRDKYYRVLERIADCKTDGCPTCRARAKEAIRFTQMMHVCDAQIKQAYKGTLRDSLQAPVIWRGSGDVSG